MQNIEYSLEIMKERGLKTDSVAIVTNTFHLYRSEKIAERAGIQPQLIPAPVPKIGLVPLSCYVREYFSVMLMAVNQIIGG